MARPRVSDRGDGLQIRRVAANILISSQGQLFIDFKNAYYSVRSVSLECPGNKWG
jgi:hypothetical protein